MCFYIHYSSYFSCRNNVSLGTVIKEHAELFWPAFFSTTLIYLIVVFGVLGTIIASFYDKFHEKEKKSIEQQTDYCMFARAALLPEALFKLTGTNIFVAPNLYECLQITSLQFTNIKESTNASAYINISQDGRECTAYLPKEFKEKLDGWNKKRILQESEDK